MARGSGTKDRTAPVINITSPINGAVYATGQTITISATATDNKAVAKVEFLYSTSTSSSAVSIITDTSSPYSTSWTIPSVANYYTITAIATDTSNNQASQSIVINVVNPSTTTTSTTTSAGTTSTTTTTTAAPLPSSVNLAMPPVIYQGGAEGSCAAMAVGYYTRSRAYYNATNATSYSYSTNIFSPEFLYNSVLALPNSGFTGDCGSGIGFVAALNFMQTNGICTFQSMPYDGYNGCTTLPNSQQNTEALSYVIPSWYRVLSTDIQQLKRTLFSGRAIAISISMDQNFVNAGPGFIWKNPGPAVIAHAMSICGYDDSKNAFKVINSAGTSWGDAGYSWIDYSVLATTSVGYYSYVIN